MTHEEGTDDREHGPDEQPPDWSTVRTLAAEWDPPALATTVVVPHPDDEVLLFGGLIQLQRRRGVDVHVVAVTDGEAAYPGHDPDELGAIRRREQRAALAALGVEDAAVKRLGLADGDADAHIDTIAGAIVDLDAPIVVAPWVHDHHCDHEACGRAAIRAAARTGAAAYFGLFWAYTHTDPGVLAHQRLIRLALSPELREGRTTAFAEHRSQFTDDLASPMLSSRELEPLHWNDEYYVTHIEPAAGERLAADAASLVRPGRGLEH